MFPEDYVRVYEHDETDKRNGHVYMTKRRYIENEDFEDIEEPTLDEVVEYLELEAESENYHSLGGVYSWLADEIEKVAGAKAATNIMLKVANEWSGFML